MDVSHTGPKLKDIIDPQASLQIPLKNLWKNSDGLKTLRGNFWLPEDGKKIEF